MKHIKNARINEEYIRTVHKSGVTVCMCPMKGYGSTHVLFGTKYGSVDTTFKTEKDEDFVTVPAGVAHYLEHKLFENEDCDAFKLFSETGASSNAYTSFDRTAYLFTCSQEFEKNLQILLNFVTSPYFTDETVAKEQGIIGQEIQMYDDEPGWRVFFGGLEALYEQNPVRVNIAGTTESIAKIDKTLLYRCYNTFYNPHNMVLSVAGKFEPDTVMSLCDEILKPSLNPKLEIVVPEEPSRVKTREVKQILSCPMPLYNIMWKLPNDIEQTCPGAFVKYNIMLEMLLGNCSEFYNKSYNSGIINDTFTVSVFNGRGFFACIADGEARKPHKVYDAILSEFERVSKLSDTSEIEQLRKLFNSIKKKTYGELVGMFNRVESVASAMLDAELKNGTMYDNLETVATVTFEDIFNIIRAFDYTNSLISVVSDS